jgi:hypothetical protein
MVCVVHLALTPTQEPPSDLHRLTNLKTLSITSCRMKELASAHLHMLPCLEVLDLSSNSLAGGRGSLQWRCQHPHTTTLLHLFVEQSCYQQQAADTHVCADAQALTHAGCLLLLRVTLAELPSAIGSLGRSLRKLNVSGQQCDVAQARPVRSASTRMGTAGV